MKKIILTLLLLIVSFSSCGHIDKLAYYQQDKNQTANEAVWQELLLVPSEYFPKASIKHYVHPPYLDEFLDTNPGFVKLTSFNKRYKNHPLNALKLWYSASFFYEKKIIHYMIMEFPSDDQAHQYVDHLTYTSQNKIYKILRLNNILFSFALRDFDNVLLEKGSDPQIESWIDKTLQKIMGKL